MWTIWVSFRCIGIANNVSFNLFNILALIAFAYCVIKIFFANIKRGGILLIQIAVGSLYMFSVPRGYQDGFNQWMKQIAALCLTAFMQTSLLFLGLLTFPGTRLSQHIAFLKDFFRAYKDFTDTQIDTIEILLSKLYARFGITDSTDYSMKKPSDFPIMEDFYKLCEEEFYGYDKQRKYLYTEETLQEVCLGIHSMCVGAESKYFNGHTNITGSDFLVFGVKGLLDTNKRLKDAMLFNILSFMSNQLLGRGSTAASIDELYLFLTNMTAIEYIRNAMKRVRKKDSSIILASQNIEDFLIPAIREYTKPLFSIPTHQFLFNAGQINPKEYMDALQVEPSEFELIKYPERGTCLYRCGNERYLLQVIAPDYKAALFGKAGGR